MARPIRSNLRPSLGAASGASRVRQWRKGPGKGWTARKSAADEYPLSRGYTRTPSEQSVSPMQKPETQPQPQSGRQSPEALESAAQRADDRARDHDLVRQAQAGEEQAFCELVQRHEARAQRVARKMVPSEEDARDLCQEAFLRVFRHLERFDFQYAFSTWLYRIVTNLAIDHLRKRRPTSSLVGSGEDEPSIDLPDERVEDPSDQMSAEETKLEVHAVLQTLAPHFQSVMALREIEGLGCPEIAEIVGATHVTVRWRLHRARKLFLEEWQRRERICAAGSDSTATNDPSARP